MGKNSTVTFSCTPVPLLGMVATTAEFVYWRRLVASNTCCGVRLRLTLLTVTATATLISVTFTSSVDGVDSVIIGVILLFFFPEVMPAAYHSSSHSQQIPKRPFDFAHSST